jgi:tetrathionate reductase subunit B
LAGLMMLVPGAAMVELANARPADQPVSSKTRWGILVDADKCARGCTECVDACGKENGFYSTGNPESDPQWIRKVELKNLTNGRTASLPMLCQHCANPPCVDVCPTGASFRRADGIVLVDKHICIGCRYCMMACPYKARSFVHEEQHNQKPDVPRGKGVVESCTMCVHRVDRDQLPACVQACADIGTRAMTFGDIHDPDSKISKSIAARTTTHVRADLSTDTGVVYQGLP